MKKMRELSMGLRMVGGEAGMSICCAPSALVGYLPCYPGFPAGARGRRLHPGLGYLRPSACRRKAGP
jgi:hypothetical protein